MTAFALLAALLAAAALAWILRPLLARRRAAPPSARELNISIYRDQLRELDADLAAGKLAAEDHQRARQELEARLLDDVAQEEAKTGGLRLAWAAVVAVPFLAAGVYYAVGNPGALDRVAAHAVSAQQVDAMVARLAAKLRENPDDAEGWKLLGRSYAALGRFDQAVDAYARAATRDARDAQLLADFADALAMARGRSLAGEPEKLVLRALEIDPRNLKALALAGTAAFDRKDFDGAARIWRRMLPLVSPDSEDARVIQANIDEALTKKGGRAPAPVTAPAAPTTKAPAAPAAKALRGEVRLAETLKKDVSPDDVVFIFARAAQGPPVPLAVLRKRVRELPVRFALDDSMAMAPGATLSAFPRVIVSARVSKSGSASAQPGDLQGASAAVANDASGVRVVIDSVVR